MARKQTIISTHLPYHITARSNNKEWFNIPLHQVWKIMTDELKFIQQTENVIIHSFVLMANHFHLIMTTPDGNISKTMYWFMKRTTIKIQKHSGRINKIFGGRYKACLISTHKHLFHAWKYVFQNPLRAGICKRCEEYPYSTLSHQTSGIKLPFEVTTCLDIPINDVNKVFSNKENTLIHKALKRTEFQIPKNNNNKTSI